MNCKHESISVRNERCFSHSVAVSPYTEENRSAHGNIAYTEVCDTCGATRDVNENVGCEFGVWSEPDMPHAKDTKTLAGTWVKVASDDGKALIRGPKGLGKGPVDLSRSTQYVEQWVPIADIETMTGHKDDDQAEFHRAIIRAVNAKLAKQFARWGE